MLEIGQTVNITTYFITPYYMARLKHLILIFQSENHIRTEVEV